MNQLWQTLRIKNELPVEETPGCMSGKKESESLYSESCVREIVDDAVEVIRVGHHMQKGEREMEMEEEDATPLASCL